jgi:EmrB/QacA subfamily drug resistance transporter
MSQSSNVREIAPELVYKNRYIILAIVVTGIMMSVLDSVVVSIALPTITSSFHVTLQESQWTITAYLLTITSLMIIFGKISEYTGKVKLFIIGYTIFTLGSLACGLATGMTELILFRIIQAIGGAIVFGGSGGIIFQAFPPSERGRAMGYLGSAIAVGGIAGPILGGIVVFAAGWQYIFLINVPIGIVLLAAAVKYLKINEIRSKSLNLDWIGSIMLVAFMVSLILLLECLADGMGLSLQSVAWGTIFVLFLAAFLLWESVCKEPVLDLSLFKDKRFTMPILSMMISFVATFMMALVGPFYFMGVLHYNALQVGLISMISPVIMVVGAPVFGYLYDKYQSKYYSAIGMLLSAAGLFLLGFAQLEVSLGLIIIGLVVMGIGSAVFQSPNSTESLNARPIQKVAMATSVSSTARNLGMTLGTAIATIMVTVQLSAFGYGGPILGAGTYFLSHISSNIAFVAGLLCIVGAATSLWRNVSVSDIKSWFGAGKNARISP